MNIPGSKYSWEQKFQGTKVPGPFCSGEQKFQGVRGPGSKRVRERMSRGAKVPGSELTRVLLVNLLLGMNWPGSEKAVNRRYCLMILDRDVSIQVAWSLVLLQIYGKMSGHISSEGDINAMVKEVSLLSLILSNKCSWCVIDLPVVSLVSKYGHNCRISECR